MVVWERTSWMASAAPASSIASPSAGTGFQPLRKQEPSDVASRTRLQARAEAFPPTSSSLP